MTALAPRVHIDFRESLTIWLKDEESTMTWSRIAVCTVAVSSLLAAHTALAQPADDPADPTPVEPAQEPDPRAPEQPEQLEPNDEPRPQNQEATRREHVEDERTRVTTDPERDLVVVERERVVTDIEEERPLGVGFLVGGGVTGFASDAMMDVTNVGGAWEARVAIGTQLPIGLEVGYLGSAQGMDAIGLDSDAILLGNGAEAVARFNLIADAPLQPYAFGGAGLRHYRITNTDQNLSSLADSDNVFEVPVGAGANFRIGEALLVDVRGTFRFAFDDDLTAPDADTPDVGSDLNSWNALLRVGYEF